MKKFEYKEPEFKVVTSSAQDVITTSDPAISPLSYTSGPFEGPIIGI